MVQSELVEIASEGSREETGFTMFTLKRVDIADLWDQNRLTPAVADKFDLARKELAVLESKEAAELNTNVNMRELAKNG